MVQVRPERSNSQLLFKCVHPWCREILSDCIQTFWVGISVLFHTEGNADVAIAIHDGIYLQDYCVKGINAVKQQSHDDPITNLVVEELKAYEHRYLAKFIGVGFPFGLEAQSPTLSSRLWLELDIVPISIPINIGEYAAASELKGHGYWNSKDVDEQADSMARRCIMYASHTGT